MKLHPNTEAWLCDLETTKAKQHRGELGAPDIGFCCLGRAAVVYERETGIELPKYAGVFMNIMQNGSEQRKGPASLLYGSFAEVRKWVHLRYPNGSPEPEHCKGVLPRLTFLNDTGTTFKEIAAIIRANPRANPRAYLTDDAIIEE